MISGIKGIRDAYRDETVARTYVDVRFREPLGALQHSRQVRAIGRLMRQRHPRRTLEIAPGPGRLTAEVSRFLEGPGVIVEASAAMLAEARRALGGVGGERWRCIGGDAFNLPLQRTFDFVYVFRLIRHFYEADRAALYEQIRQVLNPGGLLMFDVVNEAVSAPLLARAEPGEYQLFDHMSRPDVLGDELRAAGFGIVDLEGIQHRYPTLARIQTLVAPRSRILARLAMECVDRVGGGQPLEWIVTCRRL